MPIGGVIVACSTLVLCLCVNGVVAMLVVLLQH